MEDGRRKKRLSKRPRDAEKKKATSPKDSHLNGDSEDMQDTVQIMVRTPPIMSKSDTAGSCPEKSETLMKKDLQEDKIRSPDGDKIERSSSRSSTSSVDDISNEFSKLWDPSLGTKYLWSRGMRPPSQNRTFSSSDEASLLSSDCAASAVPQRSRSAGQIYFPSSAPSIQSTKYGSGWNLPASPSLVVGGTRRRKLSRPDAEIMLETLKSRTRTDRRKEKSATDDGGTSFPSREL